LTDCLAEDVRNEEGYVAAWPRPGTTPLRCKIKYSNYVRLHRLLTGTNAVTVWEMLRDKLDIAELTTDVPDEFRAWIGSMVERFRNEYRAIEDPARAAFHAYSGDKDPTNPEAKKAFALHVMAHHKELAPILFALISGKEYGQIIYKMIRPRGDEEKTFKEDDS
jgi:RNA ligase